MQTANLSQLALSPYFFDFLDEERIHFDRILSDSNSETQHKNFIFLNKPLTNYQNIKKSDHILLIL